MTSYIPGSEALVRSSLRDTIRRLRVIRVKAGAPHDEAETETGGDPFQDLANAFIRTVARTKYAIVERNEDVRKHGNDRLSIDQSIRISHSIEKMGQYLSEMRTLVSDTDAKLAHENAKKRPKANKVKLLNRLLDERRAQLNDCVVTLQLVQEMDSERIQLGKDRVNVVGELQFGRRAKLREQLRNMKQTSEQGEESIFVDPSVGGGRLDEDESTAAQMKVIAEQDAKIDAGVDRLREGVARLHNLAIEIGGQLSMQNEVLEHTELTMDSQQQKLYAINRRIQRYLKHAKPLNCFFNVSICLLIVALIGFFLAQFSVI